MNIKFHFMQIVFSSLIYQIFLMLPLLSKAAWQMQRAIRQIPLSTCFSTQGKDAVSIAASPASTSSPLPLTSESTSASNTVNNAQVASLLQPKTLILSEQAQKAVWASQIIRAISSSQPPTSISQSLRDQLLNLKVDTSQYDFDLDSKIRDEVFALFTTGIQIDKKVFDQPRVTFSLLKGFLIFFPTNIVSRFVFQRLLNDCGYIFMGSFGIGKTLSFILFIHLAFPINKLRFLAHSPWIEKEKRLKYSAELKLLEEKKLIEDRVPKCFYWSISDKLQQSDQHLKELLLSQIDELCLPESIIQNLKQHKTLIELIDAFHKLSDEKNIRRTIIIDQINLVASLFRKWNSKVDEYRAKAVSQMLNDEAKKIMEENRFQYQVPGLKLKNQIHAWKKLATYYILSSSFQIEKELLGKEPDTGKNEIPRSKKLYLGFFAHGGQAYTILSFSDKLNSKQSKIQFCQFFLFQLDLYSINQIQKENIARLKQIFNAQAFLVKNHYRFLYIRQYLQGDIGRPKLTLLQKKLTDEELKQYALAIYEDFNAFCLKESQQRLRKFLQKGEQIDRLSKRLMIMQLITEAIDCLNEKREILTVQTSKLQIMINQYFKEISQQKNISTTQKQSNEVKVDKYFNSNEHNKQLLPIKVNQLQGTITFDSSPLDFYHIAFPVIHSERAVKQEKALPQLLRSMMKKNPIVTGTTGQYLIIQCISLSSSFLFTILQFAKNKAQLKQIELKIHSLSTFLAFNQNFKMNKSQKDNSGQYELVDKSIASLRYNLSEILQTAQKNPNQGIFGTPIIRLKQDKANADIIKVQDYAFNSETFDFILVKFIPSQKIFEITTFDVTCSKTLSTKRMKSVIKLKTLLKKVPRYSSRKGLQFTEKEMKSLQKKEKMQIAQDNDDNNKYRINHVIISPSKTLQTSEVIVPKLLTVSYCLMQQIQFRNCSRSAILRACHQAISFMVSRQ